MKKPILLLLGVCLSFLSVVAQDYTVFNFEDVQPTILGYAGEGFASAVNPTKDAVNGSDNAGMYTHKGQWNDVSISVPSIDTRIYSSYEVKLYSPFSITGKAFIACFSATGVQLDWYEQNITTAGTWFKFTRNVSFGQQKIARMIVSFNRNSTYTGTIDDNTVYFDDLIFKKSSATDLTLYNEDFAGGYATWEGPKVVAPSSRNGRWRGGVNCTTPSDESITLVKNYSIARQAELLLAPSAAATSPGPVVTFSGVDLSGFDNLKLQIGADWSGLAAEKADFDNVSLDVVLKTPKLEMQSGSGSWVSIPLVKLRLEGWDAMIQNFDLSTYALGSSVSTLNYRLTSAPNLTTVFYSMLITGRIPTGTTTDIATEKAQKIYFYPNPAKDFVSFNSKMNLVTIYDLQGHEVLNVINPTKIDVRNLKSGIYILNAKAANEVINSKLIIE